MTTSDQQQANGVQLVDVEAEVEAWRESRKSASSAPQSPDGE